MSEERSKRRTRRLTDDERALWDYAALSMSKLERAKARFHPAVPDAEPRASPDAGPGAGPAPLPQPLPKTVSHRVPLLPPYVPPVSQPISTAHHTVSNAKGGVALPSFEAKAARRLRGGRIAIEGRIDLHGMRQDEARGALFSFLRSAQARGCRYVLVITGKGAPRGSADSEPWSFDRPQPPGVLRRNVPMWLASPELRSLVVSYTEAAQQHGGGGALYVQIRGSLND